MSEKIRNKILNQLMHYPGMSFNELWNKQGESNTFSYHLKSLETVELIEKKDNGKYYLTSEGKSFVAFTDGATGEKEKQPLVALLMVVFDNQNNILLYERLKEPFYGYFGFPGAKLKFGEEILTGAARELQEETNLTADLKVAGLMNYNTYNNDKLLYHHTHFVIVGENPKGDLKREDREGKFEWISKEEFLKKKLFPDNPYVLDWIEKSNYFHVEMDRFQENDDFKKIDIKSVSYY